ncbi:MAG TPA: amino acid adenylation domain-containing protein [Thermoanaerobaculia bacterium]|nr:amino acid adenylation domain-containing protein [Thermoanaerobaculia bacterium]
MNVNGNAYRLSPQQRRIWSLQQGPWSALAQAGVAVEGELDRNLLRDIFARLTEAHEILRTVFPTHEGMKLPAQAVLERAELSWSEAGFPSMQEEEAVRVARLLAEERRFDFDFARGPLLRVRLAPLAPQRHLLALTLSALCADAWTLEVFVREIAERYAAAVAQREWDDQPLPYVQFSEWQNELLEGETREAGRAYWNGMELPPVARLRLPFAGVGASVEPATVRRQLVTVPVPALEEAAECCGVPVQAFLLAAWLAFVGRITGESDVVVGAVRHGRDHELLHGVLGPMAICHPVHSGLDKGLRFLALVRRIDAALQEGAEWQESFRIEETLPPGEAGSAPFFPFGFAWEQRQPRRSAGNLSFLQVERFLSAERFDLALCCVAGPGSLLLELQIDAGCWTTGYAGLLAAQFETLLAAAVQDPEARIEELDMLSEVERHELLAGFNPSSRPHPQELVHRLFSAQAVRAADRAAVVCDGHWLSYSELESRADRLARQLRRRGVGPEVAVVLRLERSAEMVVVLLGVLKAGGAYVPLDVDLPGERLASILTSLRPPVVVTQRALSATLPEGPWDVLCLEETEPAEPGEAPQNEVATQNLAYVLFTSGSTGMPKGVAVAHGQLLNYLYGLWERLQPADYLTYGMVSTFAADLGHTVLFTSLCTGGTLCVIPAERTADPEALAEDLAATGGADSLKIVPSHLAALLRSELAGGILPRQTLVLGGDVLHWDLIERVQELASCAIFNHYGPTETTVGVLTYRNGGDPPRSSSVPLGRPIANVQVYVLDGRLQPVPRAIPGELYVGGESVARGYLGLPEQTATRFIPDPFGSTPGGRLYATGDLVRHLPEGGIEFLGRVDLQVKIRGFRVELEEIEAALCRHPQLRQVVLAVRGDRSGEQRLVAYVVPAPGASPGAAELRGFLRRSLPEFMLPAAVVALRSLPLTANGKVDRRALPEPEQVSEMSLYVAPRTPAEAELARIWQEILGFERVGIHDNFFDLGGDSILSIQIISRAHRAGLHLTPKQIFQHQTIADLAAVAVSAPAAAARTAGSGPVVLTPIQRWFFALGLPAPHHFNQAILLMARETLDPARLEAALVFLLREHEALSFRFLPESAGWRQLAGGAAGAAPAWLRVDLGALPRERRSESLSVVAAQLQGSLDLTLGPLLRVAWFDLAEESGRLLLIAHHLVIDGVSWRILLEDLETAYRQMEKGEPVHLMPEATPFRLWSERLAELARSPEIEAELSYWLGVETPDLPLLPLGGSGDVDGSAGACIVTMELGPAETTDLLQRVPRPYRTRVDEVLLTALALAVSRWSGERCVRVELEGHGREPLLEDVDLSRTVGWFTTHFPALLDLHGLETPGAALKGIKEQLRHIPRRGIGYGLLRYLGAGGGAVELSGRPHLELRLNYLGQLDRALPQDSLFAGAAESVGPLQSPGNPRDSALDLTAAVSGGRLTLHWSYGEGLVSRATVERLAGLFLEELRGLIVHCLSPQAGGYTPSDFPLAAGLAGLDQARLDALAAEKAPIADLYPLSSLQRGLLFEFLYNPKSGLYVQQLTCVLQGRLDRAVFQSAWRQLLERNPTFRTSFVWQGLEVPLQVVHAECDLRWEEDDWRGLPKIVQEERLAALIKQERDRGIDPAVAPLMRIVLVTTADQEVRFLWTYHHLILDGWSVPVLLRELFSAYAAALHGETLSLPRTRPFRDYIEWLLRQDLAASETFWRRTLAGLAAPTSLGADRKRLHPDAEEDVEHDEHDDPGLLLSPAETESLRLLARRQRLTPNTLLQAGWALLLRRYGGEEDLVFGVTLSGRPPQLAEVDTMVGLFINTLPLRTRVDDGQPLTAWLPGLQALQVELAQHQASSLAEVQRWSDMRPGQPLFESIVVFENYPVDESAPTLGSPLGISDLRTPERAKYPLVLILYMAGEQLQLRSNYDHRLFDRTSILRRLEHLKILWRGFVDTPEARLGDLPLVTEAERFQLLSEWNAPRNYPVAGALHEIFERQAASTPLASALIFGADEVSYGELNRRANRLAHRLLQSAAPGRRIALCLDRSLEMVVGVLAVLKAGAAYVPVDPNYPQERKAFLLQDSAASLLLTLERWLADLPPVECPVLCLEEGDESADESVENPGVSVPPESPAYVIYTSGSTGRPKGVLVSHANVVRLFAATAGSFRFGPEDVWTLFHSYAFDFSVWELWGALLHGGRVVIVPHWVSRSPEAFYSLVRQAKVTVLNQTPSAFHQFLWAEEVTLTREGRAAVPDLSLRYVIFGGEALDAASLAPWFERHGDELPVLVNMYGITETTVHVTWCRLGRDSVSAAGSVIGRPIPDLEVYLLDGAAKPVPFGVAGEVYVGGAGLASGYLDRPALTAERFVPHPLAPWMEPGARLYRTGDLARFLDDGQLQYLGRIDDQVKVRGFRIELGEIQAALLAHAAVRDAVVVPRSEDGRAAELAAYLVLRSAASGEAEAAELEAVREHLKARLPEYMVPSRLVALPALPLTAHGKVDRRALPELTGSRPAAEKSFVPPATPLQEEIAAVWAEVLRLERVGIEDNFFELGGHSLTATRVIVRLNEILQMEVPVRTIFLRPTIRELAESVESARSATVSEAALDQKMEALRERIRQIKASQGGAV